MSQEIAGASTGQAKTGQDITVGPTLSDTCSPALQPQIDAIRTAYGPAKPRNHISEWRALHRTYSESQDIDRDVFAYTGGDEPDRFGNEPSEIALVISDATGSDTYDFWALTRGGSDLPHPAQDTTIVYLYLPFWSDTNRIAHLSLDDSILWFSDGKVQAHGTISEVHEKDAIVMETGMIVPVTAQLNPHPFIPFDVKNAVAEPWFAEVDDLLADTGQPSELRGLCKTADGGEPGMDVPQVARCLEPPSDIGYQIANAIYCICEASRLLSEQSLAPIGK